MDALTLVRQDHRKLEALLERCEQLGGGDEVERAALLGQLQAAVRHHIDQEESLLYTIFRERARRAEVDLAPLDQALEQHRLIDRLTRELTDADDDTLQAKITVLAVQVRKHLDTEDATLLTAIEDLIDDDTLIELGRRMEQRGRVIEARRDLVTLVRGAPGSRRRLATTLGGLVAVGTAALAVLVRRRRPPPSSKATGWRRIRRR